MDLVLHVGLPKTGTTTIQRHLLAGTPGYLGKDRTNRSLCKKPSDLRELVELATKHRFLSSGEVKQRTQNWVERVLRLAEEQRELPPRITLSEELLTMWRLRGIGDETARPIHWPSARTGGTLTRQRPLPVAEYISEYLQPAWASFGRISVVITLRNQTDWLASQYAQKSDRIRSAGQADFETQIERLLGQDDPAVNWYAMVEDLAEAVGWERAGALVFENIGTREYWQELARFMGLEDAEAAALSGAAAPRENVRATGETGSWGIRPRGDALCVLGRAVKRGWPDPYAPRLKNSVVDALRSLELALITPWLDRGRGQAITVTPELRARIQKHCAASNARLAAWLNQDLEKLGY